MPSLNTTVTYSGATFTRAQTQTVVGTGVLQPFVRIQNDGGENKVGCGDPCIESGYNTIGVEQFETKDAGAHNWTHEILAHGRWPGWHGIVFSSSISTKPTIQTIDTVTR